MLLFEFVKLEVNTQKPNLKPPNPKTLNPFLKAPSPKPKILYMSGIASCTPREVANSAWAYSTIIGLAHAPWLTAVSSHACERIAEFDMQCVGNVLWSSKGEYVP